MLSTELMTTDLLVDATALNHTMNSSSLGSVTLDPSVTEQAMNYTLSLFDIYCNQNISSNSSNSSGLVDAASAILNMTATTAAMIAHNVSQALVNFTSEMPFDCTTKKMAAQKGPSALEQIQKFPQYWVAKYINNYKFFFLMVLSGVGNVLSLLTLKSRMFKSSSCFYMANLAIWDTVVIWAKGWYLLITLFDWDMGHAGCKFFNFLLNVAIHNAVWLVVIMTIERFLAVSFPLKVALWCTITSAKIATATLLVICILINAQYLYLAEAYISPVSGFSCRYALEVAEYATKIWSWVDMAIYAIIPQFILFFLNISIIVAISRSRQEQAKMATNKKEKGDKGQVTAMLLTVSIVFFVCTAPWTIFHLTAQQIWIYKKTFYEWSTYLCINTILRLLADVNHCINFFLYVVSGKKFREDLRSLLCCGRGLPSKGGATNGSTNVNTSQMSISTAATAISMTTKP